MKKSFIVANWKSNKATPEVEAWLKEVKLEAQNTEVKVIICPAYVHLPRLKQAVSEDALRVSLGAQDISPFGPGAYTGEVNGLQIKDFAEYVLIGHSERRTHFKETDEEVLQKIQRAVEVGLTPIFCIQDVSVVADEVKIVAYEPIFAIGTGKPDTPENANAVARKIKEKNKHVEYVLYGGSVTAENIKSFGEMEALSGVLVGKASLDAQEFSLIVKNIS